MKYIIPGIVLLFVSLIVGYVVYILDWGGIRSAQVTNSAKEVREAIEVGLNYCEAPQSDKPTLRHLLSQASTHTWNATQARNRKEFGTAYSELAKATAYIEQARQFCPVMSVPSGEPLWERPL